MVQEQTLEGPHDYLAYMQMIVYGHQQTKHIEINRI